MDDPQFAAGGHPRKRDPLFVNVQIEHLIAGNAGEQAGNSRRGERVAIELAAGRRGVV